MKRSQMVKEIKAVIRAQQNTLFDFQEGHISYGVMAEKLAESILKHIEEKQMLPPSFNEERWVDAGDGQGFTTYTQNEWEPEDHD